MNTQEQILTRLSELHDQRQVALNEVALLDGVISFWEQQLDSHKDSQDTDVYGQMFGPEASPTLPSVSYTYTDTPLAEEYYGG